MVAQEIGTAALVIPAMLDHRTSYKAGLVLAELFGRRIPLAGTRKDHQLAALLDTCSYRLSLEHYQTIAAGIRFRISLARDNHVLALGRIKI